ncbi:alanine/glycine:cation symporter family protein [Brevibacterium litoralis]|uniref:alanine/glycine:cation symporter family protein n=1 Tax=Brevibacterium litoralis TaxID=3138935 RepID=UPI0032ED484F
MTTLNVNDVTTLASGAAFEEAVNNGLEGPVSIFESIIFFSVLGVPIVLVVLVASAVIFTLYFGFIQFRGFGVAIEVVRGKFSKPSDPGEVTHFQALTSAVSATVGLGNIAGVGIAMAMGGPGAAFWMVVCGLLGMCTKFVECTLGVMYREIDEEGVVHGGPFKYLPVAFRKVGVLGKILTGIFAVAILVFGVAGGGMFQANQAITQIKNVTGGDAGFLGNTWMAFGFGVLLAVLVGVVIIGGIKSIGRVTDKLVPAMAILYVFSCLVVILGNAGQIIPAIGTIFAGAFTPQAGLGGLIGVLIVGFQRAAFSNEAGIGSAPIAHSTVKTRRPVSEGFVAMLEPFLDTVVVCLMTALSIIIASAPSYVEAVETTASGGELGANITGVTLTSDAFGTITGWWPILLTVAVVLFAFSTLITWAYYGQKAWHSLFGKTKVGDAIYKLILLAFIIIGSIATLSSVVRLADSALFLCVFINVLGLFILMPKVKQAMREYLADRKSGKLYELGEEDDAQQTTTV